MRTVQAARVTLSKGGSRVPPRIMLEWDDDSTVGRIRISPEMAATLERQLREGRDGSAVGADYRSHVPPIYMPADI